MAANVASLVNQQLYHAELLLARIHQLDPNELSFRAEKQALLNASVHALYLAYIGFLKEVAESAQLAITPHSVEQLVEALAQDNRSHAVVASVVELLPHNYWLGQLIQAEQSLFQQAPNVTQTKNPNAALLVAVSAATTIDASALATIIDELSAFVSTQRAFLQEW